MRIENYIPNKQFRYYYSTLNKYDQNAYDTLLNGLLGFKDKIVINFNDKRRLSLIFSFMKLDIPELFYVQTISVEYKTFGLTPLRIFPKYRFQYSIVCGMLQDMESKYKTFISFGLRSPEIEREQMIHDLIVKKIAYRDADKPYSHEAPGALLYDISVCEGVSKAVKWLCDRMQLRCIVAIGESFANGNLGGHSWNLIWIRCVFLHTINKTRNIFFINRKIMIALMAAWYNRHILRIRLVKKATRRDMIFCFCKTTAISATVV